VRRWVALGASAIATAGAALAFAQGNGAPAEPAPWSTRPEVPGAARTLVPFGVETTPAGPRAWALGLAGDATVVLQRAPGGGWSAARLATGRPVGGQAPQHAGEMTADGHGAVLLAEPTRLFTRAPGAAFTGAPDPGAALAEDEQLVGGARTLLAVLGGDAPATLVAPTTADGIGRAVLRLDADGWQREPLDAPVPVHPVGLAAAGPGRAWMLATAGDRVVLLRRDETALRWVLADFDAELLNAVAKVEVSAPPADPLTATSDGLWIDLRITPHGGTAPVDLTERLKVTEAPDTAEPTATPIATATATATPSATPTPAAPQLVVEGRWCDLEPLCDHPLGFTFAHGARGYRSVATAATADAKFGTREISAPVDRGLAPDARAHDAQRQGGYAALEGEAFALRDGIGEDGSSTTQAIAFSADGTGFTGGTIAFGAVSRAAISPPPASEPLPLQGDALISGASAPAGDGRVFAFTRSMRAMLYAPGQGWSRAYTPLSETGAHNRYSPPMVIAWPRKNLMIGGGAAGLLTTITADPVGLGSDVEPRPSMRMVNFDALRVQDTVLAIACTPSDPLDCVAVGLDGLIVRGDGLSWRVQALPDSAPEHTHITGVAFDGRTPLLATTDGLYVGGDGDGYARDDGLRARMLAAGLTGAVSRVVTVAGGGIAVDGRFARDNGTAEWRPTAAPLELHPYALAAYRDANGAVRAIVSATSDPVPLPDPVEPEDDRDPPGDGEPPQYEPVPPAPSPADAVVLRETADGWFDLDRASFQRSGGRDLPEMTLNTRAILVDGDGTGLLLGGVSDASTTPFDTGDPDEPTLGGVASARRLERGALVPVPREESETAETPAPPGAVRLAVGGHPACLDRCGGAGGQGYGPDLNLQSALARVRAMSAGGAGPAALLIGGGRASLGGEPLDPGGARRYRELTQGAGVPTYVLPGPGDLPNGGAEAFASAFASAPAPQGTGDAPAGVDLLTVTQPEGGGAGQARSTFAFDVKAAAGTVRIIAIDNAAGRLAGGPDGAQARWIRETMEQARRSGFPSIVVGSMPLDDTQAAQPAEDAAEEIALLAGRASAYVATAGVDDPADRRFGGVLAQREVVAPGIDAVLPLLQSSTLGYAPAHNFTVDSDDLEGFRQTDAALLMIDVAVGRLDPSTGVAPVSAGAEPLLEGLALDQAWREIPLGWAIPLFVTASDPTPRRFLVSPAPDEPLRPASSGTASGMLIDQCRFFLRACATVVPTNMTFTSSDPRIARFVAVRPGGPETDGDPVVVLDAAGNVVDDPRGFICPLAIGTVDVTVTALGRRVASPVRVVPVSSFDDGDIRTNPIPAGTCAFPTFTRAADEPKPAATPQEPAATTPPAADPAPAAPEPQPGPQPAQPQPVPPAPAPAPPVPAAPAPPAPAVPAGAPSAADPARPPVAPAPKPPVPPAPPAPPQGLQVQQVDAPQVQPFQAMQHAEQRRAEYAYEADSAAVAYAHPRSPLPWEIAGGVAVLALVMAGGGLAGRSRSRAVAVARSASAPRG
jgi:hypothetical protein